MQVVVLLAATPGKLISRAELAEDAWLDRIVGDGSLTQTISKLRRALVEASGRNEYHQLIETAPKRGYRLAASVTEHQPAKIATKRRFRRLMLTTTAVIFVISSMTWFVFEGIVGQKQQVNALAVLSFRDFIDESNLEHLAMGLADQLIDVLAASAQIRVISRTSSLRLESSKMDTADIAETLGVQYLLEGSFKGLGSAILNLRLNRIQ